jgi:hypothetical protein
VGVNCIKGLEKARRTAIEDETKETTEANSYLCLTKARRRQSVLSPLRSREEILSNVLKDKRVREMVRDALVQATVKGDEGLVSEPE